jgi:hypothetical protein
VQRADVESQIVVVVVVVIIVVVVQGGSNMTGTNCDLFTHK